MDFADSEPFTLRSEVVIFLVTTVGWMRVESRGMRFPSQHRDINLRVKTVPEGQ